MAIQYSGLLQGGQLGVINTQMGASAGTIIIYNTGAVAHADTVTGPTGPLVTITVPGTPMTITNGTTTAAAVANQTTTPWTGVASGTGVALSWRMFNNGGTCVIQGNMSDLVLNNTSINSGQTVTVTQFQITAGNW
jgi:hypothetical protein